MTNRPLKAVDLYAGAGGLSLGLTQAGIHVVAAVEVDHWAAATHRANFPSTKLWQTSVADLPEEFFESCRGVDVVVGGPPCQGFSIAAANRRQQNDPRNDEPFTFITAALRLEPTCILLENVPELARYLAPDGELLLDKITRRLERGGYQVRWWIADVADFGVPQRRRRLFLVGSKLPIPDLSERRSHSALQTGYMKRWRTVQEAISDLPVVRPREVEEDAWLKYGLDATHEYPQLLKSRKGGVHNHVPMRHSPRLVERFASIPVGGNGAQVWDTHPASARGKSTGQGVRFHQNHRRLSWFEPSPTITAYMYSTCVHPSQHRNITVREAARIQSFPDDFRFHGKRTTLSSRLLTKKGLFDDLGLNQLNQVGNAVPPIMGCTLGTLISNSLLGCRRAQCA